MCILDDDLCEHQDIVAHILMCRDLISRVERLEAAWASLSARLCCDSDRPEDCGDRSCPEPYRYDAFGLGEPCELEHPVACGGGAEVPDYARHAGANTSLDGRG